MRKCFRLVKPLEPIMERANFRDNAARMFESGVGSSAGRVPQPPENLGMEWRPGRPFFSSAFFGRAKKTGSGVQGAEKPPHALGIGTSPL
jgi:hypothetical protein